MPIDENAPLPVSLRRTGEGRRLSRFRYHNAEEFFRGTSVGVAPPISDKLYSIGIVIQLGLSAHLLDVGFDDRWCARHIGLNIARSLSYANGTAFGFDCADFELLAALLSPYGKWRNCCGEESKVPDFPFTDEEVRKLVRALLNRVHDVTGHPRPRGWRTRVA